MKRNNLLLSVFFLALLTIMSMDCLFSGEMEQEEYDLLKVVYLGGNATDENAIKGTEKNPAKSFEEAFGLVESGWIIMMLDDVDWNDSAATAMKLKGSDFAVTINGKGDGKTRRKIVHEMVGTTPKPIVFSSCKGIFLTDILCDGTICASGSPLVINGASELATVYGGTVYSGGSNVIKGDTKITLEEGKVSYIYGGSYGDKIDGNTEVNIIGGKVTNEVIGGGNSASRSAVVSGNTVVNIFENAELDKNIVILGDKKGPVSGKKTINFESFKGKLNTISGADDVNLINSEVTVTKLKSPDYNGVVNNINFLENSTLIASSDVTGTRILNFSITGELSGEGTLVLNKDAYLSLRSIQSGSKFTIKTDKPYVDNKQVTHTLLLNANSNPTEVLDKFCFMLDSDYGGDKKYILDNGAGADIKNIYIVEAPKIINISLELSPDLIYDGMPKLAEAIFKDWDGKVIELTESDYTIKYYKGTDIDEEASVPSPTDAGVYLVRVILKDYLIEEYELLGESNRLFSIEKAEGVGYLVCEDVEFGGILNPVGVSSTNGNEKIIYEYKERNESDDRYSLMAPVEIGNYTLRATFCETDNYYSLIVFKDFSILPGEEKGDKDEDKDGDDDSDKDGDEDKDKDDDGDEDGDKDKDDDGGEDGDKDGDNDGDEDGDEGGDDDGDEYGEKGGDRDGDKDKDNGRDEGGSKEKKDTAKERGKAQSVKESELDLKEIQEEMFINKLSIINENIKLANDNLMFETEYICGVPYYIEDGKEIIIGLSYSENGMIRFVTQENREILFKENSKFYEDIEHHWCRDSILFICERELLPTGENITNFEPDDFATKGIVIALLGKLYDIETNWGGFNYNSTTDGMHNNPYLDWALESKIIKGDNDGIIDPYRIITREEMACIVMRFIKYAGFSIADGAHSHEVYSDDCNIGEWASADIYYLSGESIIMGTGNNIFNPKGELTRGEVCVIIDRLLKCIFK